MKRKKSKSKTKQNKQQNKTKKNRPSLRVPIPHPVRTACRSLKHGLQPRGLRSLSLAKHVHQRLHPGVLPGPPVRAAELQQEPADGLEASDATHMAGLDGALEGVEQARGLGHHFKKLGEFCCVLCV